MRLVDLVKIDHRFEKSVNILLDLNDRSKLKLYIPTRSSVKLLGGYLNEDVYKRQLLIRSIPKAICIIWKRRWRTTRPDG